ncbi:hypothetical protein [Thalassotalea sp. ND16A]|uniref:hypothetical protein n=1 Tax=Thalassotalea sp. ND16A TaxID=1535422 RepID=UPI00051A2376|nr:hypothetical protein [Thalassotalea sp. ND16A]KGK00379.1 hypothetical protein ND16A_3586 [Thalassotalea sp. ND16A]
MLYLFFGYFLAQFFPLIERLYTSNIALSALFFSLIVFVLWTFIPMLGYLLALLCKANGNLNRYALLAFGAITGSIENALFYFDLLSYEQNWFATFTVSLLFFIIAFISVNKTSVSLARAAG